LLIVKVISEIEDYGMIFSLSSAYYRVVFLLVWFKWK